VSELPADIAAVLAGEKRWAVVCADCLDVLPLLPDRSVQHTITDPPYEAEVHQKSRRSHRGPPNDKGGFVEFPIEFDAMDDTTRATVGAEIASITERWMLVFCQVEGVPKWRRSIEPHGPTHRRTAVWIKPDSAPQFTGDRPASGCEFIEMLHAKGKSRWNGGGKRGVYIHNCNSQLRKPDEDHQTPKPLPLMLELVELFTDPDDLILDPFCGSGTTGVAAVRLGRRFVGIEREQKWADLSRERISAEEQGSTLQARRAGQIAMFGK
jgi:site-specific DNA-methyltransferase (adenine-specific)